MRLFYWLSLLFSDHAALPPAVRTRTRMKYFILTVRGVLKNTLMDPQVYAAKFPLCTTYAILDVFFAEGELVSIQAIHWWASALAARY